MKPLQFRLQESLQLGVKDLLLGPHREFDWIPERGFIGLISAGTGIQRRVLLLHSIVSQEEGWVYESESGLKFSPRYFSRALTQANQAPYLSGIIIVHSHPGGQSEGGSAPSPSSPDLRHERMLLWPSSQALKRGAPVASGIVGANGRWRVREYAWPRADTVRRATSKRAGPEGGEFTDAESVRIIDPHRIHTFSESVDRTRTDPRHDSSIRLWGQRGQEILGRLTVGVAGAGGVGSLLVEQIARLGFGRLILVDFDVLDEANLNRSAGARTGDVGRPKVSYLQKLARKSATALGFEADAHTESVAEWGGIRPLLDADIILNAADSAFARQVLDFAGYAYEIPVVDGGTTFTVQQSGRVIGKSQISEAGPGRPCLECQGVYTRQEATMARESPRQLGPYRYVVPTEGTLDEETPRAPSVISHNSLVAALMVQRTLRIALGFPPYADGFQQRFYVESGEVRWGPVRECLPECPKKSITGFGDGFALPVGVDLARDGRAQLAGLANR